MANAARAYVLNYPETMNRLASTAYHQAGGEVDDAQRQALHCNTVMSLLGGCVAAPEQRVDAFCQLAPYMGQPSGAVSLFLSLLSAPAVRESACGARAEQLWNETPYPSTADAGTVFYNFQTDRLSYFAPQTANDIERAPLPPVDDGFAAALEGKADGFIDNALHGGSRPSIRPDDDGGVAVSPLFEHACSFVGTALVELGLAGEVWAGAAALGLVAISAPAWVPIAGSLIIMLGVAVEATPQSVELFRELTEPQNPSADKKSGISSLKAALLSTVFPKMEAAPANAGSRQRRSGTSKSSLLSGVALVGRSVNVSPFAACATYPRPPRRSIGLGRGETPISYGQFVDQAIRRSWPSFSNCTLV